MKQERVTLSQTELRRVLVLQKVLDGHITVQDLLQHQHSAKFRL